MTVNTINLLVVSGNAEGFEFIREAKRLGCRVFVLTSAKLKHSKWPEDCVESFHYYDALNHEPEISGLLQSLNELLRSVVINRVIAAGETDYTIAHRLREHLRLPGAGDPFYKYQADKLAVKVRAAEVGISTPDFVHVLNHQAIREFTTRAPYPYILKPRFSSDPYEPRKIENEYDLWETVTELENRQSFYYLERFVHGRIYHLAALVNNREVEYSAAIEYGLPSMEITDHGRVFSAWTVPKGTDTDRHLLQIIRRISAAFNLPAGLYELELIEEQAGKLNLTLLSGRIRDQKVVRLIEAASGLNLITEWAKLEVLSSQSRYLMPPRKNNHAGIVRSIARQPAPDLSRYDDPQIVHKNSDKYAAEIIFSSEYYNQIAELVDDYTQRFFNDFFAARSMEFGSTA